MGKTENQKQEEVLREQERLRLLGKHREVLMILGDETAKNAVSVLNFCIRKIEGKLQEEAQGKLVRNTCPDDFKT